MALQRQRVIWTGFQGAPGVSTLYFSDAAAAQTALHDFLTTCATDLFTGAVTLQIEQGGDILNELDGTLTGTWTGALKPPINSGGSGSYSAPVGMQVQWLTGGVIDGRHLVGKTFLVPCASPIFDTDGTVNAATMTAIRAAAAAFVAATSTTFKVFHTPRASSPAWTDVHGKTHPARVFRAGGFDQVTSARVPDKAIVLRSRRD